MTKRVTRQDGLGQSAREAPAERPGQVPEIYLPSTLPPLFPGLPRRLELDASSVDEAI
jgi:hypothetical protein